MKGFDVNRFLHERRAEWDALELLLADVERKGISALGIEGARRFGKLYRAVSSDLIRARTELVDASVVDYLNDLVARSYAQIHAGSQGRGRQLWAFFAEGYPRMVRAEWKLIAFSAALFFVGATVGAIAQAVDPTAMGVLMPDMFQDHAEQTPTERVASDNARGAHRGDEAVNFSSMLFTNNIKVTFVVFAMGITFGVGTAVMLFYNGVPLGALATQYHQDGQGVFFWAWILPHGIPELTSIFIAGGAGLLLARGLLMPGRRRRRDALLYEARRAAHLVVGTMPVLVMAGLIEGTISQLPSTVIPYAAKLAFAAIVGAGLYAWLIFAGRRAEATSAS